MSTKEVTESAWQDVLQADRDTPEKFTSALLHSFALFKKDLTEDRGTYPAALIDWAIRHHAHALLTQSLSRWTESLDQAVRLSRSLMLSSHYTILEGDAEFKTRAKGCTSIEDLASLGRATQLHGGVIKGYKEIWDLMRRIDTLRDDTEAEPRLKEPSLKTFEKMLTRHWALAHLECSEPNEVAQAMPGWWLTEEAWLAVPAGDLRDPRSSEETIRPLDYEASGGFVDSPETLSEVDA